MSRHLLLAVVMALLVAMPSGCASGKHVSGEGGVGTAPLTVSDLSGAGMQPVWQTSLSGVGTSPKNPEKKEKYEATVRNVYLYDETLLVETADRFLYSFDRKTGEAGWVTPLPDQLQVAPTLYDRKYYTIAAGRLTIVDYKGSVNIGPAFPLSPSTPLVVDDTYFYATDAADGLGKYDKVEIQPVWPAPARVSGVILGTPILTEDLMLLFATSAGEVVGVDSITASRRIDLTGFGPIFGGLSSDGADFYFGSGDFYLYDYSLLGSLKWRTLMSERPTGAPVIAGDVIYMDSVGGGLWAFNKADGAVLWYNPPSSVTVDWYVAAEPQDQAIIDDLRAGKAVQGFSWYPYSAAARSEAANRGMKLPEGVLVLTGDACTVSGDMLALASAGKDKEGKPVVNLRLGPQGSQCYTAMLAGHPGCPVATVINNEVHEVTPTRPIAVTPGVTKPVEVTVNNFASKGAAKAMASSLNTSIRKAQPVTQRQSFVSWSPTDVYRIAPGGRLWDIEPSTGRVKGRVDISRFFDAPRNTSGDGLVYLISEDGLISCITAK